MAAFTDTSVPNLSSVVVFSGNGQHGNPERETLEMLLSERGDEKYTVHLTYPVDEIDVERKKEAKKKGKPWSPKKQGVAALFDANPNSSRRSRSSMPRSPT